MAKKLTCMLDQLTLRTDVMVLVRCTPPMSNTTLSPSFKPNVCMMPASMLMAFWSVAALAFSLAFASAFVPALPLPLLLLPLLPLRQRPCSNGFHAGSMVL